MTELWHPMIAGPDPVFPQGVPTHIHNEAKAVPSRTTHKTLHLLRGQQAVRGLGLVPGVGRACRQAPARTVLAQRDPGAPGPTHRLPAVPPNEGRHPSPSYHTPLLWEAWASPSPARSSLSAPGWLLTSHSHAPCPGFPTQGQPHLTPAPPTLSPASQPRL